MPSEAAVEHLEHPVKVVEAFGINFATMAANSPPIQDRVTPVTDKEVVRSEMLPLCNVFSLNMQMELLTSTLITSSTSLLSKPSNTPPTAPPTLSNLPYDVREHILRALLHNLDLERPESVTPSTQYSRSQQYGLSPDILRTCRSFYDDGIRVLYGSHRFYIAYLLGKTFHMSPVTRYMPQGTDELPLRDFAAIHKIKKWTVVVSAFRHYAEDWFLGRTVSVTFLDFCRALCNKSNISLHVRVIRKGIED
jgi:hypothetical protein